MPEFLTTEDFTTPIESLKAGLKFIQTYYDVDRIKDRETLNYLLNHISVLSNC